ncbi:hypothetical protein M0657_001208 [Pyricularia oryzae]|nr:hypothetical protein M9X92_004208 [Pyricularia oryzae]KAI7931254.1 hypothetical protein M0657_001208 [Pyricularia oryzae]
MLFRNSTVGDQCQGLWSGYRYCISITENPDNGEDPSPATSLTASISICGFSYRIVNLNIQCPKPKPDTAGSNAKRESRQSAINDTR